VNADQRRLDLNELFFKLCFFSSLEVATLAIGKNWPKFISKTNVEEDPKIGSLYKFLHYVFPNCSLLKNEP